MIDDVLREDEEQTIEVEKENYTIGFFPEGELEVTTNGTYNVSSYATTGVNVQPNLQQKSISVTQNGTQTITADSGYDGLSEAEVNIAVPQPSGEVEITANGTYNVAAYETAEVNVSSGGGSEYNAKIDYTLNPYGSSYGIKKLITKIEEVDLKDIANASYLLQGCSGLTEVKFKNTGNVTNMQSLLGDCSELVSVSGLDTSNASNLQGIFNTCTKLNSIPNIDTSQATNLQGAFQNCRKITEISTLNTINVTNMTNLFTNCLALVNIPTLNMGKVTSGSYMFTGCSSLSNQSLSNIISSLLTATAYTGTKTLKQIGLSSAQATTCTTLPNWAELEAAGWSTGY